MEKCQYCKKNIEKEKLNLHELYCVSNFSINNSNLIPCEICNNFIEFDKYNTHINQCGLIFNSSGRVIHIPIPTSGNMYIPQLIPENIQNMLPLSPMTLEHPNNNSQIGETDSHESPLPLSPESPLPILPQIMINPSDNIETYMSQFSNNVNLIMDTINSMGDILHINNYETFFYNIQNFIFYIIVD